MKLTKFVHVQLAIFAVLTVIGLVVMGGTYVQLPAMFGIGRYNVVVRLAATGGLYPTANVSYRGTNIGKVEAVRLTPAGVEADLSINSDYKVPSDSTAWVRSVSASSAPSSALRNSRTRSACFTANGYSPNMK